jgi:hypothetical protein
VAHLPLAPPALPGEALSSWIARIAARYDISGDELVRYLLPNEGRYGDIARSIDERADPRLEVALADAAGQPGMDFAAQRLAGLPGNTMAAWPRRIPAWCPVCAFEDVAARGEVHARRSWGVGATMICVSHGCLLVSECPRCLDRIGYRAMNGRLRLWCDRCESAADTALAPSAMPFWPFGLPQQYGRCRTVSLSNQAGDLLLGVQRALLANLVGKRIRSVWTRQLKASEVMETLRRLCFVMLGPLWEDAQRPPPIRDQGNTWRLPDDWTPGSLPPVIAGPALLASVTFLAAEAGKHLAGVTWDRQVLRDGEKAEINGETLPWHLGTVDATLARRLLSPSNEAFAVLLGALCCDIAGLGATREARRRRYGIGAVVRERRLTAQARLGESDQAREARERRARCYPPGDRYSLRRLMPDVHDPPRGQAMSAAWRAELAVLATMGASANEGDVVCRIGWAGTLMESRYVQYWIARHRDHGFAELTAILTEAVDRARGEGRGLVLPELERKPIAHPWSDAAAG